MIYTRTYPTPVGTVIASAQDNALTGLWFDGQKYFPPNVRTWQASKDYPVLVELGAWLSAYFAGKNPPVTFPLAPRGSQFREQVWHILQQIPYGQTTTYGAIAKQLAAEKGADDGGKSVIAAQAVGGAVGHNPISIVIPCHRVIGSTGKLTGYAGGLDKKIAMLKLEGIALSNGGSETK
jgi:methylated-DNA-[protein]-cysteine S-methyltransferase